MRAVKNNLPTPSGEVGESEGPRWTRAVEDQSGPIPREITRAQKRLPVPFLFPGLSQGADDVYRSFGEDGH